MSKTPAVIWLLIPAPWWWALDRTVIKSSSDSSLTKFLFYLTFTSFFVSCTFYFLRIDGGKSSRHDNIHKINFYTHNCVSELCVHRSFSPCLFRRSRDSFLRQESRALPSTHLAQSEAFFIYTVSFSINKKVRIRKKKAFVDLKEKKIFKGKNLI